MKLYFVSMCGTKGKRRAFCVFVEANSIAAAIGAAMALCPLPPSSKPRSKVTIL
jgi:hypothetical protein